MGQKLLSTGDAAQASGLTPKSINDWRAKKLIVPLAGGGGQGDHCRWTVMQTLGMAVANELRNGDRGCVPKYAAQVVASFGRMSEAALQKQFGDKNTHFVLVHQGRPVLQSKQYDWVDVEAAYHRVTKTIAKIERQLEKEPTAGRQRGLAGVNQ